MSPILRHGLEPPAQSTHDGLPHTAKRDLVRSRAEHPQHQRQHKRRPKIQRRDVNPAPRKEPHGDVSPGAGIQGRQPHRGPRLLDLPVVGAGVPEGAGPAEAPEQSAAEGAFVAEGFGLEGDEAGAVVAVVDEAAQGQRRAVGLLVAQPHQAPRETVVHALGVLPSPPQNPPNLRVAHERRVRPEIRPAVVRYRQVDLRPRQDPRDPLPDRRLVV